ncbi:MAG TPA: DHA2 family efflux MFS transporter permease subunit [Terriglobia bacterium]|nr:DHA2 family efflux MFS transporter permease subunit [Terriglobia bacterium]
MADSSENILTGPPRGGATALALPWSRAHNPWLIASVVAMSAFMELLDASIANVALPHMAGSLSSSNDEATWILTSYLVANAIILPLSGWISNTIGRKKYFMLSLLLFTISSVLCGIAPSLSAIIVFRVMQGAGGGGLQPVAQAILADTFPESKRGQAFALYGITTVLAPIIGPTLGGWITDNYSWRWIFFINIPVGILALMLVQQLVQDPPYLRRIARALVKIDYIGIGLLTVGIACLQVMLDKGQEDDWFGSHFILTLAIIAAVTLVALFFWEWHHDHPVIDVRLFKHFNFLTTNLMMFGFGVMMFGTLVMMPLYLQTLMGYTAETAGLVLSFGGLFLLMELPLVGRLLAKVQARRLVHVGWALMALGMWYSTRSMDTLISFHVASWVRVLQVIGLPLLFVPLTTVVYVGLPSEKNNAISALINFIRNIGMSFGTSIVTTILARRAQFHQQVLVSHLTPGNVYASEALHKLTQTLFHAGLSASDALNQAYGRIYHALIIQSVSLAYIDAYHVFAIAAAILFLLSFFLKKNEPRAPAGPTE